MKRLQSAKEQNSHRALNNHAQQSWFECLPLLLELVILVEVRRVHLLLQEVRANKMGQYKQPRKVTAQNRTRQG